MQRHLSVGFGLAVLLAAALFLVLGRSTSPAHALLERLEAAYRNLESAHYTGWRLDPDGRKIEIEIWSARPYRSWGRWGDDLEVYDGTYGWRYVKGAQTAERQKLGPMPDEMWQRLFDLTRCLERVRRGMAVEDLGTERLNGIRTRKIRLAGEGFDERDTWWLDPKTDLVLQQISERRLSPDGDRWQVVGRSTRIEYNVPPPLGIFTFKPLPGVKVVTIPEGQRGHFSHHLTDGRVLARHAAQGTEIELLAFQRSLRGHLFVVVRNDKFGALPLELVDSDGGRYVGRHLPGGGGQPPLGHATIFFHRRWAPATGQRTYELRVARMGTAEDPWPPIEPSHIVARFKELTPEVGRASLDSLAQEFARHDMHVEFDFLRASGLGLTAYQEGSVAEATAHLTDAVRLATNPRREDTQRVYLALADLYGKADRREEARALVQKAYDASTHSRGSLLIARRAVEAMEQLGDRETARRWVRDLLDPPPHDIGPVPSYVFRLGRIYERLSGDPAEAERIMQPPLEKHLREQPGLGSGDAWEMGQFFERVNRSDLALECYVKGLETSDLLTTYRASGGKLFKEDAERMIAAVRRLGGEEAVKKLTPREVKW